MANRRSIIATGFLLSGGLVAATIALTFPELPLSACTDVGHPPGGPPGGFVFYEFYWGWIGYSPDGGVNRCDTPIVSVAMGLLGIGAALLGFERRTR